MCYMLSRANKMS